MPFEDSPQEILARCQHCIPVKELVSNTIAAHRIAFARYQEHPTDPAVQRVAFYSLHAIVMAAELSDNDCRTRLDYLSDLPEIAWEARHDFSAQDCREETLKMLADRMSLS